jgi:hypothetical protein
VCVYACCCCWIPGLPPQTDQSLNHCTTHQHTAILTPLHALLAEREAAELQAGKRPRAVGVELGLHRLADVLAQHWQFGLLVVDCCCCCCCCWGVWLGGWKGVVVVVGGGPGWPSSYPHAHTHTSTHPHIQNTHPPTHTPTFETPTHK